MLKIRLARVGKKKKPTYRFIVSEAARDTHGKVKEILGHYNPVSKVVEVKKERILYWISVGAQVSPTVHNLLVDQNVITTDKVKASKAKKKKKKGKEEPAQDKAKPEVKPEEKKEEVKTEEKPAEGKEAKPKEKPQEEKPEPKVESQTEEKKESKKEETKPEELKQPAEAKPEVEEEKKEAIK